MPVELADSYESIYRQAVAEMSAGNADEAIDLMLRIVRRLGRLQPETLERKSNLVSVISFSPPALQVWPATTLGASLLGHPQDVAKSRKERSIPGCQKHIPRISTKFSVNECYFYLANASV